MLKINTHTHSDFSPDSVVSLQEYKKKAVLENIKYIAITDHFEERPINNKVVKKWKQHLDNVNNLSTKNVYFSKGLEISFDKVNQDNLNECFKQIGVEYIINSVHRIDGESVYHTKYFENKEKDIVYDRYLMTVLESVDAKIPYDTIGHLGFLCRKAPYQDSNIYVKIHYDKLSMIFEKVIQKGKIIEINPRVGNNKDIPTLPSPEILKLYHDKGGELVTFASDSHSIDDLMYNYDKSISVAKEIGFKYFAIKKNNKLEMIPLQ